MIYLPEQAIKVGGNHYKQKYVKTKYARHKGSDP